MSKHWLMLVLILAPIPNHADFDEAVDAYRRNDFFSAIELLLPLAEEADARAQTVLA